MFTLYPAAKVITMNPARPHATHVAVRDGRILGAGTREELERWGEHEVDERFADKVIMPGFVEGHCHVMEGVLWRYTYCGYFDRTDPDGKTWKGLKDKAAVLDRLREAHKRDGDGSLSGWGFDPIYFEGGGSDAAKMNRADLDAISTDRPIGVMHASGHIMNVNSKALELADLLRPGINHPGVPLGSDGLPTGELKGPEVMTPVNPHVGFERAMMTGDERGLRDFGKLCVRAGVTTATDLAAPLPDEAVDMMLRVTGGRDFPVRVVPLRFHFGTSPDDLIAHVLQLRERSTDRLRLGRIKVIADGSIQGFSARLRPPGYHNGAPNGLWYITPEHMLSIYEQALANGILVHTHTNGDGATQLALDTLERALSASPAFDHRFTIQHGQMVDAAQFRRMARLGMCANLFANHHFYWGDEHYRLTVGPERAERMNAARTALDTGVPLAVHSDAPITPLAPLFTAWCAVNRLTASGRVQGEHERITVAEALRAITLGAAYTLKLDGEIGSIEAGKRADLAILNDDPEEIAPDALKDVGVWGTMQDGRIFRA